MLLTSGALLVALMHVLGATGDDRQGDAPVIRRILARVTDRLFRRRVSARGRHDDGRHPRGARRVAAPLCDLRREHRRIRGRGPGVKRSPPESVYRYAQVQAAAAARAEAQTADARLAALQAQMNPHFLFNALNTVAALVRTDPRAAESTIEHLSDVLRRTLERTRLTDGTVGEEIDYVRSYIAIEAERLGPRLTMEWAIDDAARGARLPPLTIQPLVENAITHAIAPRLAGGRIRVSAAGVDGRLRVTVEDDGDGFGARTREGTGLGNLRNRLATLYAGAASLAIDSSPAGSRVVVDLPFQAGSSHAARADR